MENEYTIVLSGPFVVMDCTGRTRQVESVHIFNEGYGTIDVYVNLASDNDDDRLHEDKEVVRQILSRLRSLGYTGPDFGSGPDDLQDHDLIVLEASAVEFESFAVTKGWKNLADEYSDDETRHFVGDMTAAQLIYSALLQKLRSR
jgi:hypothetical protein